MRISGWSSDVCSSDLDAAGMAGLEDQTNYHWGNMLKAALISTLLGAGTELISNGDSDLVRALRFGTQDKISQTGSPVVQRQWNVPPTLTLRPEFSPRNIVYRDLENDQDFENGTY